MVIPGIPGVIQTRLKDLARPHWIKGRFNKDFLGANQKTYHDIRFLFLMTETGQLCSPDGMQDFFQDNLD